MKQCSQIPYLVFEVWKFVLMWLGIPCKWDASVAYCVHCSQIWIHWCYHDKKAVDSRMSALTRLLIQRSCAVHVYPTNPTTHSICGASWRIVLARSCPRYLCLYVHTYISQPVMSLQWQLITLWIMWTWQINVILPGMLQLNIHKSGNMYVS